MLQTETVLEVPFHDVDSLEIVWHGHYAKYIEIARCEWLSQINYDYNAMRESGFSWPVIDMRIRYIKPLVFGQKIVVITSLDEWEYRLKLRYLIQDHKSGQRLTKAYTIQVALDMQTQSMCFESPPALTNKLKPYLESET